MLLPTSSFLLLSLIQGQDVKRIFSCLEIDSCCPVYHWLNGYITSSKCEWYIHWRQREVRVIYPLTTDQQPVIYWATNHLLARLCFDSNTQETKKKQLYPWDSSNFPPLQWRIPQIFLTVTQTMTCISYIYCAQKRSQENMDYGKDEVIKWRQLASRNSIVICHAINH